MNFDSDIAQILKNTFLLGLQIPSPYSPTELKMAIVAVNLRSLANVLIMADDNPEVTVNLKQLALGILGTIDFLEEDLPPLENIERNNLKINPPEP